MNASQVRHGAVAAMRTLAPPRFQCGRIDRHWINRLAVDPAFRKRGVAKRLLLACEAAPNELGIEIVAALIEHGNEASVAAFESAGYQADVPVHYYRKRRRPDI